MSDSIYRRYVQTSVTLFLHCGDDYLFLKRSPDKRVDANRLNGVGGRVEPGEDYLSAAMRECIEETGYKPDYSDFEFSGVVKVEGGYDEDWVMCFFKIAVPDKYIPIGHDTEDGELMWLHKDEVLTSGYELVDDLNYCFEDIVKGDRQIFATYSLNNAQKVVSISRGDIVK
jgi:8-oxo-dGTP diphosphatase